MLLSNSQGLGAPGNAADLQHRSQLFKCALWLMFAVGGRLLQERRQLTSKELWLYRCRGWDCQLSVLHAANSCKQSISCSSLEIIMLIIFFPLKFKKGWICFATFSKIHILNVKGPVLPKKTGTNQHLLNHYNNK